MQAFSKAMRTSFEDMDATMQASFGNIDTTTQATITSIAENVRSIRKDVNLIKQAGIAAKRDLKRLNQIPITDEAAIKELKEYLEKNNGIKIQTNGNGY